MDNPARTAAGHGSASSFWNSPRGVARRARRAGRKIFQIELPVSRTTGEVYAFVGARVATSTLAADASLDGIEAEGWTLVHAGYAYRPLSVSTRDKFIFSGQQEAMTGELVGVYVFRAADGDPPVFGDDPAGFDEGGRETFRAF